MNSSIQKVLKNSALFSICTIACKAIGFFLLPLYTANLTSEELGIANTVIAFTSAFDIVVMLALREALIRFYSNFDEQKRKRFVGTVVITVFANAVVVCGILITSHRLWSDWVLVGVDFYPIIFCGVLTLFFETVYITYQSVLQSGQNGKVYSINGILFGLSQALFNVIFIVVFKMGSLGVVLGALCANVIFAVYGLISMIAKKMMVIAFDKSLCLSSLKYSIPFIPHNLSASIANVVSKLFMNQSISYSATGLYSVSAQISSIMSLVQQALNLAFRPWFNEQMQNGEKGRANIKEFAGLMFSINSLACIGIALFSQELIAVITAAEYHEAWKVVPILAVSLVVEFIYYIFALTIMYDLKASKFIAVCSITGSFASILFSALLIPVLSAYGAALAVLLAKTVMSAITIVFSRKVNRVDFGLKRMLLKLILITVLIGCGLAYSFIKDISDFDFINIVIKLSVFAVSFVILFYSRRKTLAADIKTLLSRKR